MAAPALLRGASEPTRSFLNAQFRRPDDLSKARSLLERLNEEKEGLERDKEALGASMVSRIQDSKIGLRHFSESLGGLNERMERFCAESTNEFGNLEAVVNELSSVSSEVELIYRAKRYLDEATRLESCVIELEESVSSAIPDRLLFTGKLTNKFSKLNSAALVASVHSFRSTASTLAEIAQSHKQWRHLITAVDVRLDQISSILKPALTSSFKSSLSALSWPPPISFSRNSEWDGAEEGTQSTNPFKSNSTESDQNFNDCFTALAVFQVIENQRKERIRKSQHQNDTLPVESPDLLWCMYELFSPISVKMEVHFTQWVERADLILGLIHHITRKFSHPIEDHLQFLIDESYLPGCYLVEEWVRVMSVYASDQLKYKILPHLMDKVHDDILHDPDFRALWLNTVDEILSFDNKMLNLASHGLSFKSIKVNSDIRSEFDFDGDADTDALIWDEARVLGRNLPPCIDVLCFHDDWFEVWTSVEFYEFKSRLVDVLNDESAWMLHLNNSSIPSIENQAHPFNLLNTNFDNEISRFESELLILDDEIEVLHTNAANFIVELSNELILRCKSLSNVWSRLRFIKSTMIPLIDHHISECLRLCREIEATSSLSSLKDIQRVCFILNDCYFFEFEFQKWEDHVFFLEIRKHELNDGSKRMDSDADGLENVDADEGWTGIDIDEDELDIQIENRKDGQSDVAPSEAISDSYSFFDSLSSDCRSLREEWSAKIVSSLSRGFVSRCLDYFRDKKRWSTESTWTKKSTVSHITDSDETVKEGENREELNDESEFVLNDNHDFIETKSDQESNSNPLHISDSLILLNALSILQDELHQIRKSVASEIFLKILRNVMKSLDDVVLEKAVLNGSQFSILGIQYFQSDMNALFSVFRKYIPSPEAYFLGIKDALVLLSLPSSKASPLVQQLNLIKFSWIDKAPTNQDELDHVLNINTLHGLEIKKLDVQRVRKVLRSRMDLALSKW